MARPKEFNADEALDQAMELFRRRGYEGTSMTDLQEAMGIGRQSLYDTFGDKKQLFVRALERYSALGRETVSAPLFAVDASLSELRDYFDELTKFLTPRDGSGGCLLAGTIVEMGSEDSEVTACCRDNQRAVRGAMRKALDRARVRGEIRKNVDPDTLSMLLMGQVYGMTVLARNGVARSQLRRSIRQLLDAFTT